MRSEYTGTKFSIIKQSKIHMTCLMAMKQSWNPTRRRLPGHGQMPRGLAIQGKICLVAQRPYRSPRAHETQEEQLRPNIKAINYIQQNGMLSVLSVINKKINNCQDD